MRDGDHVAGGDGHLAVGVGQHTPSGEDDEHAEPSGDGHRPLARAPDGPEQVRPEELVGLRRHQGHRGAGLLVQADVAT